MNEALLKNRATVEHSQLYVIWMLLRNFPVQSISIILITFVAGLFESIGLLALLPLFEMIGGKKMGETSQLSQHLFRFFDWMQIPTTTVAVLLFIFIFILIKSFFTYWALRYVSKTLASFQTDMRLDLLKSIIQSRWSFFTSRKIGSLLNAVSNETAYAGSAYKAAVDIVGTSLQVVLFLSASLLISPGLALSSVLAGLIVTVCLGRFIKMSKRAAKAQSEHMTSLISRLSDSLQGIKPVKAMNNSRFFLPFLERDTRGIEDATRLQLQAKYAISVFREPLVVFVIVVIMYLVVEVFNSDLAGLLTMVTLFYRTSNGINLVQQAYQSLSVSDLYYWNVVNLIKEAKRQEEPFSNPNSKRIVFSKKVAFDKVFFKYATHDVLENISMELPFGSVTALFGQSGGGKTTISDLLCVLYHPTSGAIYVDDTPLEQMDIADWRNQIAYVPQELFLFHDTVFNNITFGDPDIKEETVIEVLKRVDAFGFVSKLENGIHSMIGERGMMLSGGQRQRLSIARALVRKPRLLILDEATTALDPKTEAEIIETLNRLKGETTILAVSHQPAILKIADRVYKLDHGKISDGAKAH